MPERYRLCPFYNNEMQSSCLAGAFAILRGVSWAIDTYIVGKLTKAPETAKKMRRTRGRECQAVGHSAR
jgi:hypothetical protein